MCWPVDLIVMSSHGSAYSSAAADRTLRKIGRPRRTASTIFCSSWAQPVVARNLRRRSPTRWTIAGSHLGLRRVWRSASRAASHGISADAKPPPGVWTM
jgi:hypothetical protein